MAFLLNLLGLVQSSPDNSFLTNHVAFYNRLCVIQPINIVLVAFYLGAPSSPVLGSSTAFQNCHFAVKVKEITCASCCDIARLFDPKHYCDNSLLFPKTLDIILSISIYKHNIAFRCELYTCIQYINTLHR